MKRALLLFLLLLLSSTSGLGSVVRRYYGYYTTPYTWDNAQKHCRSSHYTDLGIIYTESDTVNINNFGLYAAWIGLYKKDSGWTWTRGNNNIYNWANNEPHDSEVCAVVYSQNKQYYGANCESRYFFICHEYDNNNYEYTFIPQTKTWSEARQYCKDNFDDLATFTNVGTLVSVVIQRDFPVWTGMYRNGETWNRGFSEYANWASNEPGNNGDCVSITDKKLATQTCSASFPFICFKDNVVLVKEEKTWEEALEHCRALPPPQQNNYYELLSVQPGDHSFLMSKVMAATTEKVWVCLRYLGSEWLWVNKAYMMYSDLPLCPSMQQHCGAIHKNDTSQMEATDCAEKLNFLCYSQW